MADEADLAKFESDCDSIIEAFEGVIKQVFPCGWGAKRVPGLGYMDLKLEVGGRAVTHRVTALTIPLFTSPTDLGRMTAMQMMESFKTQLEGDIIRVGGTL